MSSADTPTERDIKILANLLALPMDQFQAWVSRAKKSLFPEDILSTFAYAIAQALRTHPCAPSHAWVVGGRRECPRCGGVERSGEPRLVTDSAVKESVPSGRVCDECGAFCPHARSIVAIWPHWSLAVILPFDNPARVRRACAQFLLSHACLDPPGSAMPADGKWRVTASDQPLTKTAIRRLMGVLTHLGWSETPAVILREVHRSLVERPYELQRQVHPFPPHGICACGRDLNAIRHLLSPHHEDVEAFEASVRLMIPFVVPSTGYEYRSILCLACARQYSWLLGVRSLVELADSKVHTH